MSGSYTGAVRFGKGAGFSAGWRWVVHRRADTIRALGILVPAGFAKRWDTDNQARFA